jgi:Bacterial membrane protein YfhO
VSWSPLDLLPGLWVLLLAAALAGILRRWYDPVPRRVLAGFLLLIAFLFGRALCAGWTLLPLTMVRSAPPFGAEPRLPLGNWMQGDLVFQIAPWILEVRRAVGAGHWPLWNAGAGVGMPLMGDPQTQFLQPFVWLAAPFSLESAAGVTAALRLLAALVFTFLFLRRQELGEASAVTGAVSYGLGGFVMLWLGWPIGNAAALFPAVLYGVARCEAPGGRRDAALLCAAATALLLGGHPETVMYGLAVAGFLLLSRVLAQADPGARRRLLGRGAAAFLLAGCLASPVLLLAQEYLPQTHRARVVEARRTGNPFIVAGAEITRPAAWEAWRQRTTRWLLPLAAVHSFGGLYEFWGERNFIEDQCGFVGAAALLAAGVALVPGRRRRRFPHERFCAGTLAVSLALIAQPPGFDALFLRLPVIGMTAVHQHHRILLVVTFCIAALAAAEVERWRRGERRRAVVAAVAALLAGLILWAYLGHPAPRTGLVVTGFLAGGLAAQLAALAVAAALLLIGPGAGERRAGAAAAGFALLCAAELLVVHRDANPASPARVAYPVTPVVRFLQENLGNARLVGLGNCLLANVPLVYGLRDARIDNPSQPSVHANLTQPFSRNPLTPRFGRPLHPLYDLLGVRYVVARAGLDLPLRLAFRNPQAWVWERPSALPPLFLPRRARVARGEIWTQWVQRNTDFAARALVSPSPGHRKHWRARPILPARLDLVSWEGARLRARVDLAEPRLLATSLLQDGHWRLLVDRTKTPTVLANGPLVAAWLPAGRHDLELLYRPGRLLLGCALAALALAAAGALWVRPPVRGAGGKLEQS